MNKCKNCIYWARNEEEYKNKNFGDCCCEKFEYDELLTEEEKNKNDDMLLYWDFEGYSASFETGQNFGCIHFKEGGNNEE